MLPPNHPGANLLIPLQYRRQGQRLPLYSYILIKAHGKVSLDRMRVDMAGENLQPCTVFAPNIFQYNDWLIP